MASVNLFIESKLPIPLTKEQIYSYLEKYRHGDFEAREKVIVHNIRLVLNQVCKKFFNTPYDKKELVSVGLIGLVKSVDTFDIEKNFEFATYATRCIDNEILMFMRRGKKYAHDESLYTPIGTDKDGNGKKLEDILEDTNSDFAADYEKEVTYREIRRIVQTLPDRDREIIMLYFGFIDDKTYTQSEIAKRLNMSRTYVSRLINKIVKEIGAQLEEKGVIELAHRQPKSANVKLKTKIGNESNKQIEGQDSVLKNNEEKMSECKMSKKLQSIYEYFKSYTKEQIDDMLLKLSEEERQLITLRYGDDLENPISDKSWGKEENTKFYGRIVPKMKRLLANPNGIRKVRQDKTIKTVQAQPIENEMPLEQVHSNLVETNDSQQSQYTLDKEDYIRILEMLRTPTFGQLMSTLSPKDAVVIALKLGYVDQKYFSTESISEFLGIDEEEVRDITKKVLLVHKENIVQFIDKAIDVATDKAKVLNKKDNKSN